MFYVGQKVCCITPKLGIVTDIIEPDLNDIATVANVYWSNASNCLALELVEFPAHETEDRGAGWMAEDFRPIVDTKAEVSFTIGADPDSDKWDNRKVKVKS